MTESEFNILKIQVQFQGYFSTYKSIKSSIVIVIADKYLWSPAYRDGRIQG
jgi:hypothetical protein